MKMLRRKDSKGSSDRVEDGVSAAAFLKKKQKLLLERVKVSKKDGG